MGGKKISEWSRTYDLPRETVEAIYTDPVGRNPLWQDSGKLAYKAFRKNSGLVIEFLRELPPSDKERKTHAVLRIELLAERAINNVYLGQTDLYPHQFYEDNGRNDEISELVIERDGKQEWKEGEPFEKKDGKFKTLIPAYITLKGGWPRGWERLLEKTDRIMESGYFIFEAQVGNEYVRTPMMKNSTSRVIDFMCATGTSDKATGSIWDKEEETSRLGELWSERECRNIRQRIRRLDGLFLRRT